MPAWIHDRAKHIQSKNPDMDESTAWALATQQAHKVGKTPKGYGTVQGRQDARAKYTKPKSEYKKTAGSPPDLATVIVRASRSGAEAVERLLKRIKEVGDPGHSFSIIEEDPPDGGRVSLGGWDGDGACRIESIEVQQAKTAAGLMGFRPGAWRAQAGFTPPGMQTAAQRLQQSMRMGALNPSKGLHPLPIKVAFTVSQYSGPMNPGSMKYESGAPPFTAPPLKTAGPPSEKKKVAEVADSMRALRVAAPLALGGGALLGAGSLLQKHQLQAVKDKQKSEAAPELYSKVRAGSPVPIHAGKADYTALLSLSSNPAILKKHFGMPATESPDFSKPLIVLDKKRDQRQGLTDAAILAHEIGHAELDKNPLMRGVQLGSSFLGSPLVPLVAGGVSGFVPNRKAKAAILAASALPTLGTLGSEMGATALGLKRLEREGATPEQLGESRKVLRSALGTYGAQAVSNLGAGLTGASYGPLFRMLKQGGATTPAGRLAASKAVGLPRVTAPPGPSIAQIAKPKGIGTPMPGATKSASEKLALLERLVRLGATPIPATPKLLMRVRSPAELGALQRAVDTGWSKRVTEPLLSRLMPAAEAAPGKLQPVAKKLVSMAAADPLGAAYTVLGPGGSLYPAAKAGLERGIDKVFPLHG